MRYAFCVFAFFVGCKAECKIGDVEEKDKTGELEPKPKDEIGKAENVKANVDCTVNSGPSIDCVVNQTQGKKEIDVCWDVTGSCPNGATLKTARTCQKVKDGGSATVTIPTAKITLGGPTCDANPTVKLENMTINGEKSTN